MATRQRARQLQLFRKRRKRKMGRPRLHDAGIAHRARVAFASRFPLHVTVRMESRVCNLRAKSAFGVVRRAIWAANARVRVCHFSVQGNHIHMLIEAADKERLSAAMMSLGVRIGRNLNRLMQTRGRVIAHRYHARVLRTPTEVANARHYVLRNSQHHAGGMPVDDPFSSLAYRKDVQQPLTWLLNEGWQRARPPS